MRWARQVNDEGGHKTGSLRWNPFPVSLLHLTVLSPTTRRRASKTNNPEKSQRSPQYQLYHFLNPGRLIVILIRPTIPVSIHERPGLIRQSRATFLDHLCVSFGDDISTGHVRLLGIHQGLTAKQNQSWKKDESLI